MTPSTVRAMTLALGLGLIAAVAMAQPVPKTPVFNQKSSASETKPLDVGVKKSRVLSAREITDISRRRLQLRSASTLAVPKGALDMVSVSRPVFLAASEARWRALDKNKDGILLWQGATPAEPLGAVGNCTVVLYQHQSAKHEKDPAHPGQWIDTADSWKPNGWSTYAEILAATTIKSDQCKKQSVSSYTTQECTIPGQPPLKYVGWSSNSPIHFPCISVAQCSLDQFKSYCASQSGAYVETVHTSEPTCTEYFKFGPDSLEAFLDVAKANFDTEDWNHDGVVAQDEGDYLCSAP